MARGKHRLPTPVRLVAAAAAVLTVGGIVVAAGSASADNASESSRAGGRGDPTVACRAGQALSVGAMLGLLRERPQGGRFAALPLGQDGDGRGDGAGGAGQDCDEDQDQGNNEGQGDNGQGDDNQGKGDDNQGQGGNDEEQNEDDQDQGEENEEFPNRDQAGGPFEDDFVAIEDVSPNVDQPDAGGDASTGTFTSVCGTNAERHQNSDNYMQAPDKVNAAQHVHDYVGNLSTDAFSNDDNLPNAGTTCAQGDESAYFWPVLRDTDQRGEDEDEDGGGLDGNFGEILQPTAVDLEFRGNPAGPVQEMPQFLRLIVGDAKAATNGDEADVQSQWTCTGFEDRTTTQYPLCPQGSNLMRVLDFPSCWDGENLDSEDHKSHIVFPDEDGSCDDDTVAVPQLRMTLVYDQPDDGSFALDTFPEQQHDPRTDHGQFENLMPEQLMETAVDCINTGRTC